MTTAPQPDSNEEAVARHGGSLRLTAVAYSEPLSLSHRWAAVRADCHIRRVLAYNIDVYECWQHVPDRPAIGGDRHIGARANADHPGCRHRSRGWRDHGIWNGRRRQHRIAWRCWPGHGAGLRDLRCCGLDQRTGNRAVSTASVHCHARHVHDHRGGRATLQPVAKLSCHVRPAHRSRIGTRVRHGHGDLRHHGLDRT